MGSNLVAVSGDIQSSEYNPATLSGISEKQWQIAYVDHLLDFQGGKLAYAQPTRLGVFSGRLLYFNYGSFDETDEFGVKTGNTFGASEFALSAAFSNTLGQGFEYGLGIDFIYSSLESYNASAVALSAGLLYHAPIMSDFTFGVSILHLGKTLDNYTDEDEKLPVLLKIGFAKKLAHLPLLFTGSLNDITASENQFMDRLKKFSLGGEFTLSEIVRLRLGYENEIHRSVKPFRRNSFGGVSFGLGVIWKQFRLDYAFSNFGDLGSQNRIGICGTL